MVKVVGHRGTAGLEPENTLGSFRRAIELGVHAVECDVHLTGDGQVVVMHDPTVDRTTNGTGAVAAMTLSQLRRLDAGAGQVVPTLEELLDVVKGHCELLCEVKADAAATPAAELVGRRGMARDVVFISFDFGHLAAIARLPSRFRLGALLGAGQVGAIQAAQPLGIEAVIAYYRKCPSREAVVYAHGRGLSFGVYTPNTLEEMTSMIALGVDFITTDRPDILVEHLRK